MVVLFLRSGEEDEGEISSDEIMEATLVASNGEELDRMTVVELKGKLRSMGLSTSGKKADLING